MQGLIAETFKYNLTMIVSSSDDNNELEFTNVDATLDLDLLHSEEKSVVGQGHENNTQQEFIRYRENLLYIMSTANHQLLIVDLISVPKPFLSY